MILLRLRSLLYFHSTCSTQNKVHCAAGPILFPASRKLSQLWQVKFVLLNYPRLVKTPKCLRHCLLLLSTLLLSSVFAFCQAPVLTSMSPTVWAPGMQVTLTGTGFGASANGSSGGVYVGGYYPTIVSWSDTQVVFTVPSGIGPGNVLVYQNYLNSNTLSYTMVAPVLTSMSPTVWAPGMQVTLTGTGFGASANGSSGGVYVGGYYPTIVSWSDTQVVFTVPSGIGPGGVLVYQNYVNSNTLSYTMVAPVLTSMSPTVWAPGMQVTLTGTGFGASANGSSGGVYLGGYYPTIVSWSDTQVVFTVPSGIGPGGVLVYQNYVNSNTLSYTMVAPVLTSISPTTVSPGMPMTLTGSNFGPSGGGENAGVYFGYGAYGTIVSWSNTQVVVTVPNVPSGNVLVFQNYLNSNSIAYTIQAGPFVATTGQMETPRSGETATQLTTGQVLIAGGMSTSGVENSAELYTTTSQTFAAAANAMNVARWLHTATLLNDGTVLIAGGSSLSNETTLNSAEIYDPVAGTFTLLPNTLNTARVGHTATLLSNGQVLIVGGYDPTTGIISDAELYDPTAQVFIDLGNTNTPRFHHTATLLQNGQVLISGGETDPTPSGAYNTAEIFNPATWAFTALSVNMTSVREGHAATLLNNGQVLVTGGDLPAAGSLNTSEIYDPVANTFTAVSATMTAPRIYHDAVLLNGGTVLLSGGETDSGGNSTALNSAEIYNPTSQTFTAVAGNMVSVREHQTATLLNDGTVLEDGGTDGTNIFNTAEIYTASKLTGLSSIAISPATPSVPLGSQQLLVATGTFSSGSTQILSSVLWSSSSTSIFAVSNDASDTGFATSSAQGSGTVTASAAGISGSTTVTVPAPTLVLITLSPQSLTMPLGTTQQFTATGTYSDGSTQDLTPTATWTSSSSPAAVNNNGLVTGASLGSSSIQASSGSQSASTTVTVGPPALVSIALAPSNLSIPLGSSQQYQVTGTYSDGSTQNITNSVEWSSLPANIVSLGSAGYITGAVNGTATIQAALGTVSGSASLTIGPPALISVTVSPATLSIDVGGTEQLSANGTYSNYSGIDITSSSTWLSSNPAVASVSATGFITALASGSTTITATSGTLSGAATLTVGTSTGSTLNTGRYQQTSTLLNDGTLLIAGGINCPAIGSCSYLASAESYNPDTGRFTYTGSLATARSAPAVVLPNGNVLIAGGYACDSSGNCSSLNSAEIYHPDFGYDYGYFTSAGNMTVARSGHTITLLNNGQVLIAGGHTCISATSCTTVNAAEIYNPVAGSFTPTGNLNAARYGATATALNQGLVLIAGGYNGTNYPAAAELYDPTTGTFSVAASLNTPRANATATVLNTGQVLIAGGSTCASPGCPINSAELYNPTGGTFTYTGTMNVSRFNHTATLLTDGQVLLAGGYSSCPSTCTSDATAELYDPIAGNFMSTQALTTARSGQTSTLLPSGNVILAGGTGTAATLASVDTYQPSALTPPGLASITIAPANASIPGEVAQQFVAVGIFTDNSTQTLSSVLWNSSNQSVTGITNDVGGAGFVYPLSAGTTTITASAGSVGGSTVLNSTVFLTSITITPLYPTVLLNQTQQLVATGTYSDGSTSNVTTSVTWSSSNSTIAAMSGSTPGLANPVAIGTANITVTYGSVSANTSLTVEAATPAMSSVLPSSGPIGTMVSISGSDFGTTQGSVTFNGTPAAILGWNNTSIIAQVPPSATTGPVQASVSGVLSNTNTFSVTAAVPTIVALSELTGAVGDVVTITGSGFGSGGAVSFNGVQASASSWSNTNCCYSGSCRNPNRTGYHCFRWANEQWRRSYDYFRAYPHQPLTQSGRRRHSGDNQWHKFWNFAERPRRVL